MIQMIKEKLADKKTRNIIGIFIACALVVCIFPLAFSAYGNAVKEQQEAEQEAELAAEEAAEEDVQDGDSENAKSADVTDALEETADADEDQQDAEPEAQEPVTPTWVTVTGCTSLVFDPENDANAVVAIATGGGVVDLPYGDKESYSLTLNGGAYTGDITVPNGKTLNLTVSDSLAGTVTVSGGGTLNLTVGGSLTGNVTVSGGATLNLVNNGTVTGDITAADNATLSISGTGTLAGNSENGGLLVSNGGANVTINGDQTISTGKVKVSGGTSAITVNSTLKGHFEVCADTTLNLKGTGTLEGTGKGSVVLVTGNNANLVVGDNAGGTAGAGCLTIKKGNGTPLKAEVVVGDHMDSTLAGGAILVRREKVGETASLTINNVNITDNHAQGGAGIYIDRDCVFVMNNGLITGNSTQARTGTYKPRENDTLAHEGGGIVICGNGWIYKGQITKNSTKTTTDWGGGGIFIESKGTLNFGNSAVLIKDNVAEGLGGGVSGCPHAKTGIGNIGGDNNAIAVYDNHALGLRCPDNQYLWNNGGKGDHLFFTSQGGGVKSTDLKDGSQDYYCTFASFVGSQGFSTEEKYYWRGYQQAINANRAKEITVGGQSADLDATYASVGLTACQPISALPAFDVIIQENSSKTHGGGIGSNGVLRIGNIPYWYENVDTSWTLNMTKNYVSTNGTAIAMPEERFNFGLYTDETCETPALDKNGNPIVATNDSEGKITFFMDAYCPTSEGASQDYVFYVKELPSAGEDDEAITYDSIVRKVTVTVKRVTTKTELKDDNGNPVWNATTTRAEVSEPTFEPDATFVNTYNPSGTFTMTASKAYYGSNPENFVSRFKFDMQRIDALVAADDGGYKLDAESTNDYSAEAYEGTNGTFDNEGDSTITFSEIALDSDVDRWYMITESKNLAKSEEAAVDEEESESTTTTVSADSEGIITDSRVYVIKVSSTISDDGKSISAAVTEVYYADEYKGADTVFTYLNNDKDGNAPTVEFANFDTGMQSMALYGYAINAASNEPIEQECFVDPKIIKNLEGRSLTEGEFNFKLIRVLPGDDGKVDWSVLEGDTISETSNDRYGMVDFDKANNVGTWDNPTCLAYVAPGTYYYRVVEANANPDASIDYSKQIITFTTVIKRDGQGHLYCADMYYGHVENGENVRYEESVDPQWHPTITNSVKGVDLKVRKTSALDRNNGLEGATYGLYAVNKGAQADILMQEATSDSDGWITFENVSLKEGTLYYFKERLAPAGHTVSEFRSGFFYIVKDVADPSGYTMKYTDDKAELDEPEDQGGTSLVAMSLDDGVAVQDLEDESDDAVSGNGNTTFTYARDGGVYDEATFVEFTKLNTRNHEWVENAHLAIINKETGETVHEWTTGKTVEQLKGKLDVDTTYILRELSAPEGYMKADDVEFMIDQYGAVMVLSGATIGNAELQNSTITLYDTMFADEQWLTEYRKNNGGSPVRTGDLLKFGALFLVAAAAIVGVIVMRRRKQEPAHAAKK